MEKLFEMDHSAFHVEVQRFYNRKGEKNYETKVKFFSAVFSGLGNNRAESRENAIIKVFKRLLDLSNLCVYFYKGLFIA